MFIDLYRSIERVHDFHNSRDMMIGNHLTLQYGKDQNWAKWKLCSTYRPTTNYATNRLEMVVRVGRWLQIWVPTPTTATITAENRCWTTMTPWKMETCQEKCTTSPLMATHSMENNRRLIFMGLFQPIASATPCDRTLRPMISAAFSLAHTHTLTATIGNIHSNELRYRVVERMGDARG